MANILTQAKQTLTNTLAETPTVVKIYTLLAPIFAAMAVAARATENYILVSPGQSSIVHDPSNTLAVMALFATSLNVIVGAAAVNHYRTHNPEVHFDNCERRYCFGNFANNLGRILHISEKGVKHGG